MKILSIGKIKDKNIKNLVEEYQKRISFYSKLEVIEIKDSSPEKETKKIFELITDFKKVYALSEEGKEFSSNDFKKLIDENRDIIFLIGGPFGLSNEIKQKVNLLSLSKMIFTHEIARLILMEQIFRAVTKNKNYNK